MLKQVSRSRRPRLPRTVMRSFSLAIYLIACHPPDLWWPSTPFLHVFPANLMSITRVMNSYISIYIRKPIKDDAGRMIVILPGVCILYTIQRNQQTVFFSFRVTYCIPRSKNELHILFCVNDRILFPYTNN